MSIREAVIIEAVRLPVGRRNGVYSETRSEYMLSEVLKGLVCRTKIGSDKVEDVIVGCVTENQEQGNNIARIATLMAGFSEETPAMTLNRKCSSSHHAVHLAAQGIIAGDYDIVIAAGIENMSRHPLGSDKVDEPKGLTDLYEIIPQGESAERIADKWDISREELDKFAYRSHQLAEKARKDGNFDREIIPIEVEKAGEKIWLLLMKVFALIHLIEKLKELKPSFISNGKITAGNS